MVKYISFQVIISFALLLAANSGWCQFRSDKSKADQTIKDAREAFEDILRMGEDQFIPQSLIENAGGLVIFPKALKIAMGVGGQGGRGIAMIRLDNGEWSNPFFLGMGEANVGAQIGVQSTDLILLFCQREHILDLEDTELTLGADVGIAIGPVGRNSQASTDIGFDAEIYSYSRSKGLYAGITVEGTVLEAHERMNEAYYDSDDMEEVFFNLKTPFDSDVKRLISALNEAVE